MIDIENEVFTVVATKLRSEYKKIMIYGDEGNRVIATFPAVTIIESENNVYLKSQTCDMAENHADLLYSVNVYSNKASGKKTECKSIIALIDDVMKDYGFTRISCSPVPNLQDGTIYRMTARYCGVVSKENIIYRR